MNLLLSTIAMLGLSILAGCNVDVSEPVKGASTTTSKYDCSLAVNTSASNYCTHASKFISPTAFGDGTEDNPYQICSPYQLNAISDNTSYMNSHFILTTDLNMSCISGNHNPIGSNIDNDHAFRGVFEGNGYSVSNWYNYSPIANYIAPFASVVGGAVRNINFTNLFIIGKNYTAGAIGNSYGGHILGIKTSGTVTGTNNVGGIIGYQNVGVLEQSSSTAAITGASKVGGMIGYGGTVHIASSKFSGSITASATGAGGILGQANFGHIENSYSNATIYSTSDTVGGIVGKFSGNVFNSYSAGVVSGTTSVGGIAGNQNGSPIKHSFSTADVSGSGGTSANVGVIRGNGSGTISNSYYLNTATCDADSATAGIQACGTNSTGSYANDSDFYSVLNPPLSSWDFTDETVIGTNDFWVESLTAYPEAWFTDPDGALPSLNGSGTKADPYLISSTTEFLKVSSNPRWMKFHYKLMANLDFHNLTYQRFSSPKAAFYGSFNGSGFRLENIDLSSDSSAEYNAAFGIVLFPAKIYNLTVENISVDGSLFTGGAVGGLSGKLEKVSSSGSVRGGYHSGGLVGITFPNSEIIKCSSSVMMNNLAASSVGGLVGSNYGKLISSSYATGDVLGVNSYGGGLIGTHGEDGNIENSYATGNVSLSTSGNTDFGGLVGRINHTTIIRNCYSTGTVDGKNYAGGLVGTSTATVIIINSFTTSEVTSTGGETKVGQIAGDGLATLYNVYYYSGAICDSKKTTGGIQDCNFYASGSTSTLSDFYYDTSVPLNTWDFSSTWKTNFFALPTLQN